MITFGGNTLTVGGAWLNEPITNAVIGGKNYPAVLMPDGKYWLKYNLDLRFTGLSVPRYGAVDTTSLQAMYYRYDESLYGWNGRRCGLLYNWYAVDYMNQNRAILFPGWHVPSISELEILANSITGTNPPAKLKAVDGSSWRDSSFPQDWGGTDNYGFAALPSGEFVGNIFMSIQYFIFFWSSTSLSEDVASYMAINKTADVFLYNNSSSPNKKIQFSVRLVHD